MKYYDKSFWALHCLRIEEKAADTVMVSAASLCIAMTMSDALQCFQPE